MPKAIKKRIAKKTTLPEEEVQERLSGIRDSLRERQRTAIKIAIVVLAVIALIAGIFIYNNNLKKQAQSLQQEAQKIYYTPSADPSLRQEQYKKALDIFRKAHATKKSPVTLYYISACQYEMGNMDEAISSLMEFVRDYSGEKTLLPLAYQKLVTALLKKGDVEGAKKSLDEMSRMKGDIYKDMSLMEYGRILENEGKKAEADKKYQELLKKYPSSPFAGEAKARLSGNKESQAAPPSVPELVK